MPLVVGKDARGRPVYSDPVEELDAPSSIDGTADSTPTSAPTSRRESSINYDGFSDRLDNIRNQGVSATSQVQDAARRAMQARLNAINASSPVGEVNTVTPTGGGGGSKGGKGGNTRQRLLEQVASQKGVPYKRGAESPGKGFDCSGLVQWAYGRVGISMPRVSGQQAKMGVRMPINKLQPGDLVAHPGHIAVYAGNGMMWEAPHTGARVRLVRVRSDMYGIHLNI